MRLVRKAQTATEYMIILAVIIIIALIVVGVMGGIPGLGGGARKRAGAGYWQTGKVGIVAYAITEQTNTYAVNTTLDSVYLKLRNNLRDTITITSIALDGYNISDPYFEFSNIVLKPGQIYAYNPTMQNQTNWNPCTNAGDSYTLTVEINYTDDETGATYSFTGEGNKLEGKCAAS